MRATASALLLLTLLAPGSTLVWGASDTAPVTTDTASLQVAREVEAADQARIEAAVERVRPSLVRIQVVDANYYEGRAHKSESSGSGAIISPDGYIVTNHHVAGNSVRLVCTLSNREEVPAVLIGTDPMSDIAVIKLKPATPRTWPAVEWGDSNTLEVGDPVLAMGSPLALSQSVTEGIISNIAMTMPVWSGAMELDGEDVGSIVRWLAHDAQIFPGNSGGPLVDLSGRIIGINEISFGLGGAIPTVIAKPVAEELIARGKIDRAFVGLMLQPAFKSVPGLKGAVVSDVVKNSPGATAGLKPGDRLLSIRSNAGETKEIILKFAEDLPPLNLWLARQPVGEPLTLTIVRNGAKTEDAKTTTLTPVTREPVLRQRREFKPWGITARDLSFWTALELKRPNKDGVLITSVRPGGPAGQAKPDLQENDIILKINDRAVRDMSEFSTVSLELTKDKTEPVPALITYARREQTMLTVVNVGLSELDNPGREVRKAWIPVGQQVLTRELARQLGIPDQRGVRVTQIYDVGNTSGTLGLKVGDLIVTLDGEPVEAGELSDAEIFPKMLRDRKIGQEVTLGILRDGKPMELKGNLVAQPPRPQEMPRYQDFDFEFVARDTAYMDRVQRQLKDEVRGVQIDSVDDGGWAALGRLAPGDTLLSVDGHPTPDVATLKTIMERIKTEKPEYVLFKVQRGIHTMFIELEPIWDKNAAPAGGSKS